MSVKDAMNEELLLAYAQNGKPLEKRNGAPLRLIVPGWYGIANVKWLNRIEGGLEGSDLLFDFSRFWNRTNP